jgi:hypothetical protein
MFRLKYILIILLSSVIFELSGQEDEFDKIMKQTVENINPVYKPVVGFGAGVLNYFGDIKNNIFTPTLGELGYKVNVATYIDNGHFYKANFYFMGGKISANERNFDEPGRNFNFQSDIYAFGLNINYDFDHFYKKKERSIHPFISLGFETVLFDSKADSIGYYLESENGNLTEVSNKLYYWTDGTIRNLPESAVNENISVLMQRDYKYETPLRRYDWGLGDYPQYAFALVFDLGLDFHLSDRLMLRLGNSFHYTFSDVIDHVSSKNDPAISESVIVGNKLTDMFNFTYVTFHLDLFSSPKTLQVERLIADIDYDYSIFYTDLDNDGWYDGWDDCPDTPPGAETDSSGCAIDSDNDGVPDYMDQEPSTRHGAFVNDLGVEITEDDLIALLDKSMAVGRNEIDFYIRTPESYKAGRKAGGLKIPDKFKSTDADKDNYISFDEMLHAIDNFFDFDTSLSEDDIYELVDFFFSQ